MEPSPCLFSSGATRVHRRAAHLIKGLDEQRVRGPYGQRLARQALPGRHRAARCCALRHVRRHVCLATRAQRHAASPAKLLRSGLDGAPR
jgi:hypothetical protein